MVATLGRSKEVPPNQRSLQLMPLKGLSKGTIGTKRRERDFRAGVSNSFSPGTTSASVAFKWLNVTLGLYRCNYSLTIKRELGAAAG